MGELIVIETHVLNPFLGIHQYLLNHGPAFVAKIIVAQIDTANVLDFDGLVIAKTQLF